MLLQFARSLPFDCAQGRLGSQPSLLGSYGGQAEMTAINTHFVIPSEVEESHTYKDAFLHEERLHNMWLFIMMPS